MTLWVIGFLAGLFIYISWGLNAINRALDWGPLNPDLWAIQDTHTKDDRG